MNLTPEQIIELANDKATAQKALKFSGPEHWHELFRQDMVIWGRFVGHKFLTLVYPVDLNGRLLAADEDSDSSFIKWNFHCNCESLAKPCEHGLALFLLLKSREKEFRQSAINLYIVDSGLMFELCGFQEQNEFEQDLKGAQDSNVSYTFGKTQNQHKRIQLMQDGVRNLENWILDLLRIGISGIENNLKEYFLKQSANLVDAKLGAIARRLRISAMELPIDNWQERIAAELGTLFLFSKAFQNLQNLPDALQQDVLAYAGVQTRKSEIIKREGIHDKWLLLGSYYTLEEDNLIARKSWFWGANSKSPLLILDFVFQSNIDKALPAPLLSQEFHYFYPYGIWLEGEVVYYLSAYPLRGLFKTCTIAQQPARMNCGFETLSAFARNYAESLAINPWLSAFPAILRNMTPVYDGQNFTLVDKERKSLKLRIPVDGAMKMLALSKGSTIDIMGDWEEGMFRPLSLRVNARNGGEKLEHYYL
jgi:hypothetical protein